MKYKQHKSLQIYAPKFPSDSPSEGNLLNLQSTYEQFVGKVDLVRYDKHYSQDHIIESYKGEDAVLVIGSARRHPKSFFHAPFIQKATNKVPIAWLPIRNHRDIAYFTESVKEVHSRAQDDCVLALLSQKHPRYVRIVQRMNHILKNDIKALQWSSDLVFRDDIINALEEGIGLAAYFGHGRPIGWVGYYGLRAHHFERTDAKVIGGILSLCCQTASRKRTSLSFCEELVINKKCAATFGAVESTLHTDNTRWSVGICKALLEGAKTIGDVVLSAMPLNLTAYCDYRIIGDPLAPIYSTKQTALVAKDVKTYP